MPTVRRAPIRSAADPDDPSPWFVLDIDPTELAVTIAEANGITAYTDRERAAGRRSAARVSRQKETAARRRHALQLAATEQVHVLAIDLDGNVIFRPEDELPPVLYAHLAWYDPASDEWTALEFIDASAGGG